jgi:hypothetical protein
VTPFQHFLLAVKEKLSANLMKQVTAHATGSMIESGDGCDFYEKCDNISECEGVILDFFFTLIITMGAVM